MSSVIRFGALLRQADNRWSNIAESARICDDLGFHSIHFIDHLLALPDPTGDILESWTTLTACAAITRRVRLGGNVLCNGFRSPALLAKMGATLDVISEGGCEFGVGAGWHEPEFRAYGFDLPRPGVRIGQLAEAVRIIKRLWAGERVDFAGRHYRLEGGICRPRPPQEPRPPLMIGGAGERTMLRLVAEEADIWNASAGNYARLDQKIASLKEHCRAVGRDFSTLTLSLQDLVVIAPTETALQAPLAGARQRLSSAATSTPSPPSALPSAASRRSTGRSPRASPTSSASSPTAASRTPSASSANASYPRSRDRKRGARSPTS